MNPALRVIVGRLAGTLAGVIVTYLASKGINMDAQNVTTVIIEIVGIFSTVYGLVHTAVNAQVNPTDVSSPAIAKEVHVEMKQEAKNGSR